MGFPVHLVLLAHLDALHQPRKCGTVQLLKLGIVPNQVQPVISGLLVLPVSLQLRCELRPLFQLSLRSAS